MSSRIPHRGFPGPEDTPPREQISTKTKHKVLEKYSRNTPDGQKQYYCGRCGNEFEDGDKIEFNHILPVFLGGKSTVSNLEPLHAECHKEVTAEQAGENAKVRSLSGKTGKEAKIAALKERFEF